MIKAIAIFNLPLYTTKSELAKLFAPYGNVTDAETRLNVEAPWGEGIVYMSNDRETADAIRGVDGSFYKGHVLNVCAYESPIKKLPGLSVEKQRDPISPPAFVVVWDPRLVTASEYADVIAELNSLVQSHGGQGIKRLESKPFAAGVPQEVPV